MLYLYSLYMWVYFQKEAFGVKTRRWCKFQCEIPPSRITTSLANWSDLFLGLVFVWGVSAVHTSMLWNDQFFSVIFMKYPDHGKKKLRMYPWGVLSLNDVSSTPNSTSVLTVWRKKLPSNYLSQKVLNNKRHLWTSKIIFQRPAVHGLTNGKGENLETCSVRMIY